MMYLAGSRDDAPSHGDPGFFPQLLMRTAPEFPEPSLGFVGVVRDPRQLTQQDGHGFRQSSEPSHESPLPVLSYWHHTV